MKVPQSITPLVERWLRDSIPTRPDAERSVDEVMTTLLRETQVRPRPTTRFLPWSSGPDKGFTMFTFTKVAAAALIALGGTFLLSGTITDRHDPGPAPAADSPSPSAEVLFDAVLPTDGLPPQFSKAVVDNWILAPGVDIQEPLANEGLRGRGIVVDGGEFLIEPAADASVWRAGETGPVLVPKAEAVSLEPGDAIFLPAIPVDEVDTEAMLRVANPGTAEATALTFHTHDADGGSGWVAVGLELGDWDDWVALPAGSFDGTDVHVRLARLTADPGTMIPLPEAPGAALYYLESGVLDQVTTRPERDSTITWKPGQQGSITRSEGVEKTLEVTGDGPASLLELTVVPVST